jgi:Ca-activated chloride channel family protein
MNVFHGITQMTLHSPLWLLLLVPLAAFVLVATLLRRQAAVIYSDTRLLRDLPVTLRQRLKRLLPWLKFVGMALLIVGLARPQIPKEESLVRTQGIAIEMCLDRSGSMQAMDFEIDGKRVNRLAAVKKVFGDFVNGTDDLNGRPDDLVGLIAFGGFADAQCPLTLDHNVLTEVLDSVEIPQPIFNQAGRAINAPLLEEELATAIGDAVLLGVDRLRGSTAKSKVLILLSDGEHNAGIVDPAEAAEAARKFGIKVYTIGVGSTGVAPFPQTDAFGRTIYVQQRVVLDEETLKMLAEQTGGRYFNARNTRALTKVYEEIDSLEKTALEAPKYSDYEERYAGFLALGGLLILLELVLASTWLRSLP